jgi:hypothetical protein
MEALPVEALLDRLRAGDGLSTEEIARLGPAAIPASTAPP